MNKAILAATLTVFGGLFLGFGDAEAAIYLHIPGVPGEVTTSGYEGWINLDSFSFGVEREMKESGEKGGTADINIGVGELQECTISKSMDTSSANLAQYAINGNSPGTAEIHFVQTAGSGSEKPIPYLMYKLDRAFIKSWSTSGDADDRPTEEVAFYYNKIAFSYVPTTDGLREASHTMSWDNVKNVKWDGHGLGDVTR